MGQTEIYITVVFTILIFIILIIGVILFIIQYKNKQKAHHQEKESMQYKHTQELVEIQQLTMEDIGRELHDNVAQKLTLASIYARQNQSSQQEVSKIIDEALQDLRHLSKELTVNSEETINLNSVIENQINKLNTLAICKIHFTTTEKYFTTLKQARFIERILQEFIQNSLKHSKCKNIFVSATNENEKFTLTTEDDGKGFDIEKNYDGIGLKNMHKRAELLNAKLEIDSNTSGTKLKLVI